MLVFLGLWQGFKLGTWGVGRAGPVCLQRCDPDTQIPLLALSSSPADGSNSTHNGQPPCSWMPQCVCGKCLATRGTDLGTVPCSCPLLRKRSHREHPQGPGFQWPLSPGLGGQGKLPFQAFLCSGERLEFFLANETERRDCTFT